LDVRKEGKKYGLEGEIKKAYHTRNKNEDEWDEMRWDEEVKEVDLIFFLMEYMYYHLTWLNAQGLGMFVWKSKCASRNIHIDTTAILRS
jgi:hypothetical protein